MRRLARLSAYAIWGGLLRLPTLSICRALSGQIDLAGQMATDPMAASKSIFQMLKARNTAYGHRAGSAPCGPDTHQSSLSSPVAMLKRQADKVI